MLLGESAQGAGDFGRAATALRTNDATMAPHVILAADGALNAVFPSARPAPRCFTRKSGEAQEESG